MLYHTLFCRWSVLFIFVEILSQCMLRKLIDFCEGSVRRGGRRPKAVPSDQHSYLFDSYVQSYKKYILGKKSHT